MTGELAIERRRIGRRATLGGAMVALVMLPGCSWISGWEWPEITVPGVNDTMRVLPGPYDASRPEAAVEGKQELVDGHMGQLNPVRQEVTSVELADAAGTG